MKLPKNLVKLYEALKLSWGEDTARGNWSPDCPSLNQCAVTALVVQDYVGGDLLRCKTAHGDSHYWNRLPNGSIIDFTADQFDYSGDKPFRDDFIVRERSYTLSFSDTVKRYLILKQRVIENMAKIK